MSESPSALKGVAKYRNLRSAFEFQADLDALAPKLGLASAQEAAVVLGLQIWAGITLKTPVRTGRARANWFMAEGAPRIETVGPGGGQAPNKADFTGKSRIFITNSLPYIIPLEYGHSNQAPAGMVRVTLAEVQAAATVATR